MTVTTDDTYAFVFRGLLTEEALDKAGRSSPDSGEGFFPKQITARLSLHLLDSEVLTPALRMAVVYSAIAAFENSVRELISSTLLEVADADWWMSRVPDGIRKKAESRKAEEEKIRWHSKRGDNPIYFTDFSQLMSIIIQNWADFSDLLNEQSWVQHIFDTMERSRNVIMHSGQLPNEDIERIGICIRDWVKQTGG